MPHIQEPTIPSNSVSITDFGAINGGQVLCTQAFAQAIDAVSKKGGGKVIVPRGIWLTGPITLKSNIEIYTEGGAMVVFSTDKSLYPLVETNFEGFNTWRCMSPVNGRNLENITVENSSGPVGQAVALHVEGDQCVFRNCRFLGFQDTLYAAGRFSRMFFTNCYIEGTTDFVFGEATALFEDCTICCKGDSYITAASTPEGKSFGFVFLNCKLTAVDGVKKVHLGRPWRIYAKAAFLNCEMGSFICPEGWHNWDKPDAEKTTLFAEYKNTGPGALLSKRVSWSRQLTDAEASAFAPEKILGDWITKFK